MTLKQAAKILGTTADNLRGAAGRGSLNAWKIGNLWVTDHNSINDYAENVQGTHGRKPSLPLKDGRSVKEKK